MKNADCLNGWRHGHIPFKTLNVPLAVLMFVLFTFGQLESNSAEDLGKSEASLKRAIKDPTFRELATCSLALVYVKRGNLESIELLSY